LKDVPKTAETAHEPKKRPSYRALLNAEKVRSYYVSFFAFAFSFATLTSGLALYCERRLTWSGQAFGPRQIGYLLAFSGTINFCTQIFFMGRLVKRFGEEKLVRFAFMSSTVGLSLIGLTTALPLFIVGISMNALGNALLRPSLSGLISKSISRAHQGLALGFSQTLMSVAQIVAPILSGTLIGKEWFLGFTLTAAMASCLGLVSTFVRPAPAEAVTA
jgi:sugar phosphate permease